MKIRSGFVSNSSSSSFVCDVCGASEGGYDVGLSDVGMFECGNGHTVCLDHMVKVDDDWENNDYGYIPGKYCPICTLTVIPDHLMLSYIFKVLDLEKVEWENKVRGNFKNNKELMNFLKNNS